MKGYSKLYSSLWDGSLYGRLEASAVFMVLLSLADADGVVDMTLEALAGRTGWPGEFIRRGLGELEAADPKSRTPTEEGRRIVRLDQHRDWGWQITNYRKYRELWRSEERRDYLREKQRESRARRASTDVNNGQRRQPSQPIADADSDSDADAEGKARTKAPCSLESSREEPPPEEVINLYNTYCTELPKVKSITEKRIRETRARCRAAKERESLAWWRKYFSFVNDKCSFLIGKNPRKWRANFDWLMEEANLVKVVEDTFADKH
jgi:hypothetical protein